MTSGERDAMATGDQRAEVAVRSAGKKRLVYDKATRSIVEVETRRDMSCAPRNGTHILAYLYREPDDCGYRGFGEWREIWWKPYTSLGMFLPWHAGDPADSHTSGEAPEHFGEAVPTAWLPLPGAAISTLRSPVVPAPLVEEDIVPNQLSKLTSGAEEKG